MKKDDIEALQGLFYILFLFLIIYLIGELLSF